MIDIKIVKRGLKCNRCGFEWVPRFDRDPKLCRKCRSAYWNKPRVRRLKSQQDKDLTKKVRKQKTSIKKIARELNPKRQAIRAFSEELKEGLE